jgi:hypothetical protein
MSNTENEQMDTNVVVKLTDKEKKNLYQKTYQKIYQKKKYDTNIEYKQQKQNKSKLNYKYTRLTVDCVTCNARYRPENGCIVCENLKWYE